MFDEKDPHQKSVPKGSPDEEVIIDLTDEIVVKTEDDNNSLESAEERSDDAPHAVGDDQTLEVEEDEKISKFDETDNLLSQGNDAITDLADQAEEDQLIASAIAASLGADDNDAPEVTQQFDLNTIDDDDAPEITQQFDLNATDDDDTPEVTRQFDLNTIDDDDAPEITRQFDLNATDEEDAPEVTRQFDLNDTDDDDTPEVTRQFDLNATDDDDAPEVTRQFDLNDTDDDDTPEVTRQFDLNAIDDDDAPEVTRQFDLNATDDDDAPEVTRQFDLNATDEEDAPEVTRQFDLNATDEEDAPEVTRQFDLNDTDEEEIIIVDNSRDEVDETSEVQKDEDVFDLEEEIELKYESDEDEDELLVLDDERADDNQDFVDLMLGISKEPDQEGNDEEQAEYFEFDTHERDDIIELDTNSDPDKEVIALAEDAAPDFADGEDLPDLEDIGGFDFDTEEDEEDSPVINHLEPDSSDDIIARTVEQPSGSADNREPAGLTDEAEFEFEDNDEILGPESTRDDDDEILALADDELMDFENDENLLGLGEEAGLEDDYEVIPLHGVDDVSAEHDEDIVEITEFDQHFPADEEALLNQSDILDTPDDGEDDFLELLDIEEDNLSDDEEDFGFNATTEKFEIDKLNQFFSDDQEDDRPESMFEDLSEMKSGLDDETIEVVEQASDMNAESTSDDEISSSEDEKFEFDLDPDAIAQQVDRLDTFLPEDSADEPAVASLPVNQIAAGQEPSAGIRIGELPTMPPGQIDAAIERVINEKFSGKIEDIIYEVIEKAVTKEIDRLKGALMRSNAIDDNQD